MAISIEMYISGVEQIYRENPTYANGHDGSDGTCDCIGMVKGSLRRGGASADGLSGTNYAARYTIKEMTPLKNESQLGVGDVVLKAKQPGESGYNLPDKYKPGQRSYNGDLQDYYHIGTVTHVRPLEITHMTSPNAKKDTKLGKWNYFGKLPQVKYEDQGGGGDSGGGSGGDEEVVIVIEYARVINGNLKLRAGAGTNFGVVAVIPDDSVVAVITHVNGTWDKVVYNSYTGYVMRKFLSVIEDNGDALPNDGADDSQSGGSEIPSDGVVSGKVVISLSRNSATELYEAVKIALGK